MEGVVSVSLRLSKTDKAALPGANVNFASPQHSEDAIQVLHGLPVGDGLALSVRLPGKLPPPLHSVSVHGVPKGQRWEHLFSLFALTLNEHTPGQGKHVLGVLGIGRAKLPTTVGLTSARVARLTAKLLDGVMFAGSKLTVQVNEPGAADKQWASPAAPATKRTSSGVVVHKRTAPPSEPPTRPPNQPPSAEQHRNVRVTINRHGGAKRSRAEFVPAGNGAAADDRRYGQVQSGGYGRSSGPGPGGYSDEHHGHNRYQGGGYQGRAGAAKQRRNE